MDYYAILGIDYLATPPEIKMAYKNMAFRYHPDKNIGDKWNAEIRFKLISEAYDVLYDPIARSRYNATYQKKQMHPTSEEYQVDIDEFGVSIHSMNIHTLADLEFAFDTSVTI